MGGAVARAHGGGQQAGGSWESRAIRETGGRGRGPGARARLSPSSGRRRELRRRQRGRVASGATSAARGRRLRQRSLLAPQLEEAPPESATARGCASHSGCLSPSRCYPLSPPGVCPRRRPPAPAVSGAARVGDAVPASCRLLCRLLPLAVVHLTASVSGAWIPEWGLLGALSGKGGGAGRCWGWMEVRWRGDFSLPVPDSSTVI